MAKYNETVLYKNIAGNGENLTLDITPSAFNYLKIIYGTPGIDANHSGNFLTTSFPNIGPMMTQIIPTSNNYVGLYANFYGIVTTAAANNPYRATELLSATTGKNWIKIFNRYGVQSANASTSDAAWIRIYEVLGITTGEQGNFHTDVLYDYAKDGPTTSINLSDSINGYERIGIIAGLNPNSTEIIMQSSPNYQEYPVETIKYCNGYLMSWNKWIGSTPTTTAAIATNYHSVGIWSGCNTKNWKRLFTISNNETTNTLGLTDQNMGWIWKIIGINRKNRYGFKGLSSNEGTLSSNPISGYSNDISTIISIPNEGYKCSAIFISGASLTGNDFKFDNSNVTASAGFEHFKELTLENGDHGILSADKMSGFSGDVVTVDATTDEGWYFTGLNVTGAVATGNKFTFIGNDVTAEGLYTDEGYPITYLADEHVHLTGDVQIYIPGSEGIALQSSYDTYYRISGYDITNGSIVNGKLVPTGPCTIKAVEKINYFSASGEFEKGSNITWQFTGSNGKSTTIPAKYALCTYKTDNVPAEWYSDNNRWKVNDASSYSITLHPVMHFSGYGRVQGYTALYSRYTGYSLVGDDISAQANASYTNANTWDFNKTYTSDTQNVYYRLSGLLWANGNNAQGWYATAQYLTAGSTGTWTATGIAP